MKTLLNLIIPLVAVFAFAAETEINFNFSPEKMEFTVPSGHHFNLQAPNKIEGYVNGVWTKGDLSSQKTSIKVSFGSVNFDPCSGIRAQLYVCDDKNTYCLPRAQSFSCVDKKLVSMPWKDGGAPSTKSVGSSTAAAAEAHFILNDSDKALKMAKESHKPLLIDFFGIWCPPCNEFDETVFNTKEFNDEASNFVLLKLDADSPASWSFKSKFHITGYPTIILADENGDEISRVVGFRAKKEFVSLMASALTNKDSSLEALKVRAEMSDDAAYKVGLIYLDREDFYSAHYYLVKASRHWPLPDVRRNKLMSAQLGLQSKGETKENKKVYEKLLIRATVWFPRQIEVFDRLDKLVSLAEELGDKIEMKNAQEVTVSTAMWYLAHPKALKGSDTTRGDLFEVLGHTYEVMDEKQKSLDAYADGAKAYLEDIKKSGLDENSERGYNLERIYCLWKSGQVEPAQNYYSKFEEQFPQEFTFYYQHAHLLKELKQLKEAEAKGLKAYEYSYGDNRLRVTALLAEIYVDQKEKKKALDILKKSIDQANLPDDKSIRTYRYYNKLLDLKKKISES